MLWVLEQLGDVLHTRAVITLKGMSKPDQEAILWPWLRVLGRTCIDYTGLGIGWGDDAQREFGAYRVELVTFTPRVKEALAYPVRGNMEDKRLRIPFDPAIRADLRAVTKVTTDAGNIRFTAERGTNGHADRFWALALALHAAQTESGGRAVGNRLQSIKAKASLTARHTRRAETKVGLSDPVILCGRAIAQRIKGTPGITG